MCSVLWRQDYKQIDTRKIIRADILQIQAFEEQCKMFKLLNQDMRCTKYTWNIGIERHLLDYKHWVHIPFENLMACLLKSKLDQTLDGDLFVKCKKFEPLRLCYRVLYSPSCTETITRPSCIHYYLHYNVALDMIQSKTNSSLILDVKDDVSTLRASIHHWTPGRKY